jgi:hypothetical protein
MFLFGEHKINDKRMNKIILDSFEFDNIQLNNKYNRKMFFIFSYSPL